MTARFSLACLVLLSASGVLCSQDTAAGAMPSGDPLVGRDALELRVPLPADGLPASKTDLDDLARPDRFLQLVLKRVGEVLGDGGRAEIVEEVTARSGVDGSRRVGRSGWISVRGTAEERRKARAVLDRLLPARDVQVLAEFTIVQRPQSGERVEVSLTVLDNESVAAVAAAARQAEGADILSAPSVLCLNGHRADISVMNQLSYVKDFDVEVAEGRVIVDPVVAVIQEGLVLDVTPVFDPVTCELTIQTHLQVAELVRPIRDFTTTVAGLDQEVTIQLPELNLQTWGTEDLVLAGLEAGFHVANIPLADSGEGGHGPRTLDLICRVQVVQAFEAAVGHCRFSGGGLVVVDWEARTILNQGDPVRFFEDGGQIGVGEVFALAPDGRSAMIRMVEGDEPHPGATVR